MARAWLDYAPAIALLAFWSTAGLGGALTVVDAGGGWRYLALGSVTVPALVLIAGAVRRVRR